jgi:hypothetical protein
MGNRKKSSQMIDSTITNRLEIVRDKKDRTKNKIKGDVAALIDPGIQLMLQKYGCSLSEVKTTLHGSRDFAADQPYASQYNALRYFFALIGDYRSLAVVYDFAPIPFCPSMDPKSIALFIYWKRGKRGDVLKDWDENIILDVFQQPVKIEGGWNDPKGLDRLSAAISLAHETRGTHILTAGCMTTGDAPFVDECKVCIAMQSQRQPCIAHGTTYHLLPRGNPWKSVDVKNAHRESTRAGAGWVTTGAEPLLPNELIQLRSRLLGSGDVNDIRLWTVVLLCVKLFLRSEEALEIDISDFVVKMTSINILGVTSKLALKVKGRGTAK